MKIKYIYSSLCLAVISFLIFTAFTAKDNSCNNEGNDKKIKFSHSLHKEMTDCQSCHSKAAGSVSLTDKLLPTMEDCKTCHDVADKEKCSTCHYENVFAKLEPRKSGLKFNHKQHVEKQGKKCDDCHKGLGDVDYSSKAKEAFPPMETCYACHNGKSRASNECKICHTGTANLMPKNHQTIDFKRTHKFLAKEANANCAMCHDNNSCGACHSTSGIMNETNSGTNFYKPYAPDNFTDGTKQQALTRAHDLNYRFTHGIDAKTGVYECQTCHQNETFCVQCHQNKNGDYSMTGVVPYSHIKPDFVTIGVGTGGGEHAKYAKREIESCAACHDTQGGDANCITCHVDPDGIKGTNPRTHKTGFQRDNHGEWHTDMGATCYSCHRDPNAHPGGKPGIGFCGYCHSSK
jgi:hypothetical protein